MDPVLHALDAHSHPQFPPYDEDRGAVIERAKKAGVGIIAVGTQRSSSESAVALARQYPGFVWATTGFHPAHFVREWHHDKNEQESPERESFSSEALAALAMLPEVVAIGECGLDYFRSSTEEDRAAQEQGFLDQMEVGKKAGKPLMIHCRGAFPDLLRILAGHGKLLRAHDPGVIHFFSGSTEEARALLGLGFAFTFGGVITFASQYDEVIRYIPSDRLLTETDAPYVTPAPHRGKRNEPAYVSYVLDRMAELKGTDPAAMGERTLENARRIFGI